MKNKVFFFFVNYEQEPLGQASTAGARMLTDCRQPGYHQRSGRIVCNNLGIFDNI